MTNETVMTFVSLLVAVLVTVALFAGNFAFAYLVDLVTGRGVPLGSLAIAVATLGGTSTALVGLYRWRAARN